MTPDSNKNLIARFRIETGGQLAPIPADNSRAGPGTLSVVNDPAAASAGGSTGLDPWTLAKAAVAIPAPPATTSPDSGFSQKAGLPPSVLNVPYVVSLQQITGVAPGSVSPTPFMG